MNTTVKIYGYTKRINDYMSELDYKEYRMDGSLYSMGSEQFSNERMREIVLEFQELFLLSGWSFVCAFSLK